MSLAASVLEGNRLALARLLTQIENNTEAGQSALNDLFPHTGRAHLVGVTGAPGTGKSSLVNQLAGYYRNPPADAQKLKVGIVAVDPSSPFSGGAILGDRVRMRDLAGDPGVFIRSMASRGSLGGLAATTASIVQALDAAGFDVILIETVGAGQAEVDIARLAHTTLVIEAPGLGDDIQAIKAGILEIADILVINKADRPGVENTERALRGNLQLAHPSRHLLQAYADVTHHSDYFSQTPQGGEESSEQIWNPPILRTIATEGIGVVELGFEINRHRQYLEETGELKHREQARLAAELDLLIQATLVQRWRLTISGDRYKHVMGQLMERNLSPWQAVKTLLDGD
ncbi:MAG TPA: methylmalonyl Co-A mutase-associated GTPase MeaB [Anaerolineales bacterium]|nr:methylmalonyl Co-A mutase-associated GTPase MeaB [Anaerolineales bacterium]